MKFFHQNNKLWQIIESFIIHSGASDFRLVIVLGKNISSKDEPMTHGYIHDGFLYYLQTFSFFDQRLPPLQNYFLL